VGKDGVASNDPAARLRAIELAVAIREPQPADKSWPQRCEPHADALAAVLQTMYGDATAEAMNGLLARARGPKELQRNAEQLWALAAKLPRATAAELIVEPPPPVVLPPRPPVRTPAPFEGFSFGVRGRSFRLVRGSDNGPGDPDDTHCRIDRELRTLFCSAQGKGFPPIAPQVHGDARWRLVEDRDRAKWPEAHPWFAIDRDEHRIDYRQEPYVWLATDGTINLFLDLPGTYNYRLFRAAPGETTAVEVSLPGRPDMVRYPRGHWLLREDWLDVTTSDALRLDASTDDSPEELQLPLLLLETIYECDHRGAVRALSVGDGAVFIEQDGRFSRMAGPPPRMFPCEITDGPYDPDGEVQFTCTAAGARIGFFGDLPRDSADLASCSSREDRRRRASVTVYDCRADGCTHSTKAAPLNADFFVPLANKVLLVAATPSHGVQFVLAPFAELASAPIEVLLDESPSVLRVVHSEDAAVVIVAFDSETTKGPKRWRRVSAFRIDQNGTVSPVAQR
jgi:hypothetical protein